MQHSSAGSKTWMLGVGRSMLGVDTPPSPHYRPSVAAAIIAKYCSSGTYSGTLLPVPRA